MSSTPTRARYRVDAAVRPSGRAGALRGRLRGHVRHEGGVRTDRAARARHSRAARAGAASGEDEASRSVQGRDGFDFLGCHLRKRMRGPLCERVRRRAYYLQRRPSPRAMRRIRQRVKACTTRGVCHRNLRDTVAQLDPVLRGWGAYFRTGNAAVKCGQVDDDVAWRLKRLLAKRHGRQLRAGHAAQWTPAFFHALGLHRLRGTIRYQEAA